MAGRFSVEAVFRAVDRVTRPVSRMQNRVGKFTRSMSRGFNKLNRVVNRFGRGMRRAGVAAAAGLALVTAGMTNVLGAGANFEQAIVNVGAVSLKTRDQIGLLEKQAISLGRTTKFTATQAANAMEILARAGFTTQEILTATPAVLNAAAASGLEIAEVADIVSNALKGMGLETSQAAQVADVLALASSRTNSSIGSLGESIKNVASTARQLNIPLEEVVASVALLQDVGLDASVAGSAFNVMLTKMAAPSVGLQKKMKALGISFKDARGNMLPLPNVLQQLSVASKKVGGNFDQVAFLAELVGLRGQKAAANLSKLFETGKLEKLTAELGNAAGSAKKMADIRMNTVNGSMLLLGSAVDAVKVKIFNMNAGPLKDTIDSITEWVVANEELIAADVGGFIADVVANLKGIVTWGKRVGIVIGVMIALSIVLKSLIAIMTIVNLVMMLNPFGLVVAGVAALVAIVAVLIAHWESVVKFFSNIWEATVRVFFSAVDAILGILDKLAASPAGAKFVKAWENVKTAIVAVWDFIIGMFRFSIDTISSAVDSIVGVFRSLVGAITRAVASVRSAFDALPGPVKAAVAILAGPIGWLVGAAALIMEHWEPISNFFGGLWDGIAATFSAGFDFITGIFDGMLGIFKDITTFFTDIGSSIASFFGFGDEVQENPAAAKAKVAAAVKPDVTVDPVASVNQPRVTVDPVASVRRPGVNVVPIVSVSQPRVTIEPVATVQQPTVNVVPVASVVQPSITVDPLTEINIPALTLVPNFAVDPPNITIEPVATVQQPTLSVVPDIVSNQPIQDGGFAEENETTAQEDQRPQMVTPQDRVARTIDEQRSTSSAELLIRDETGRAELKQDGRRQTGVVLQKTGTF